MIRHRKNPILRHVLPLLLVATLLVPVPEVQAKRTKVKFKTSQKTAAPVCTTEFVDLAELPSDSIAVEVSGYDKPLNATRESMLVTNHYHFPILGMTIEITYLDLEGRELHKRTAEIIAEIPSGATRLVEIETFDRNKSYYYIKSKKPRVAAEPYKIRIRPLSLIR